MIDEVHMLTGHAFNAMLKTLEEPPPHVVFILATTDPKKVPVTVLSRCLQFNLKNLPPQLVSRHLATVLETEAVAFEPAALAQIGRAAAGSMRDALSLLDQAIAYGGGRVEDAAVREMLGVVDRRDLERILEALVAGDGRALVGAADDMLAGNAPFERTLLDFASLLQRIALAQVGVVADDDTGDDAPQRWAPRLAAEDLQVWYQIAIHGARDLPLAPDAHAGFSMTLLRLLAFRPETMAPRLPAPQPRAALPTPSAAPSAGGRPAGGASGGTAVAQARAAALAAAGARPAGGARPELRPSSAPLAVTRPATASAVPAAPRADAPRTEAPRTEAPQAEAPQAEAPRIEARRPEPAPSTAPAAAPLDFDGDWPALAAAVVARMPRAGLVGQFMQQSELLGHDPEGFTLRVPVKTLAEAGLLAKVREVLLKHFGRPVRLSVEIGQVRGTTVAQVRSREQAEALAQAQAHIEGDAFVQTLLTGFEGTIVPDSIQPIGPTGETR
jgi:DNA polymerase-3 subunit gamma/tau